MTVAEGLEKLEEIRLRIEEDKRWLIIRYIGFDNTGQMLDALIEHLKKGASETV